MCPLIKATTYLKSWLAPLFMCIETQQKRFPIGLQVQDMVPILGKSLFSQISLLSSASMLY